MSPPAAPVRQRIVCLVGPTASGKSDLALELAAELGAEIVSADSRQVYRGLDVGTAKPSASERARVPHHLLDLVEPRETFDAARFRNAAAMALAAIEGRGRPALVVGGTGLYVRVLLRGLCPAPPRVPRLRAVLAELAAERGAAALHRGLVAVDPATAARVHPHDAVRIVRALEVALASGRRLSEWQAAHGFAEAPYDALVIGLARPVAELDARIAARARAMFAAGFLDEVRTLRARGVPADAPGLRTVGYRELLADGEGCDDEAVALAAVVRATRRFAKRQRTWFRREAGIVWRHPEHDRVAIAAEVTAFLRRTAPALPAAS
jgi:tRNA dimethylallyltransferase